MSVGEEWMLILTYTTKYDKFSYAAGCFFFFFFFQAEAGIRVFCLSRGLGDVYKRQFRTCVRTYVRAKALAKNRGFFLIFEITNYEFKTSTVVFYVEIHTMWYLFQLSKSPRGMVNS